ncbi:MAG: hypothetical protein IPM24_04840 [Bryobacterales bacterium]|nr:hypothetical protein [Bryobacterales bacterium]
MKLLWIWIVLAAMLAWAQQTAQQKKDPAAEEPKAKPAPLFGGQLGIRSSQKTKESATLGFNGIDPAGRVDQQMMATYPKDEDEEKVKALAKQRPGDEEVKSFIAEGGLKP